MKESRKHDKTSSQPFFGALTYVQFLHSDRSIFPAVGAIPWPTSSCWSSDIVGNSLGLMWPRSAWRNEVW